MAKKKMSKIQTSPPDCPLPPELRDRLEKIKLEDLRKITDAARTRTLTLEEHAELLESVRTLYEADEIYKSLE